MSGPTDARRVPGGDTLAGFARELARHATPRLLAAQLVVLVPLRLWLAGFTTWDVVVVVGIAASWPWMEWAAHRWILHLRPRALGPWRFDPLFARVHRAHHREPWVMERIFVPWPIIGCLIPVNVALWWAVLPSARLAVTGMLAAGVAALIYEWVHALTHMPRTPRSAWFRRVVRNHRLHHFKNEHHWHAFTVPWIDELTGTAPDASRVERSPTVRRLHDLD